MARPPVLSREILEAALVGLQLQLDRIKQQIDSVHKAMGRGGASAAARGHSTNRLSEEARQRISQAQKKRWAKLKRQKRAHPE